MAVTADKPGPYAPGGTILQVIQRHRDRGLPTPINAETLARSGIVTDSLMPRTLQALQVLDLINDKGEPTSTFEGIRKAPEGEYKARLADWLNSAYADVLQFVDPAKADETQVRDAFRNYNPVGQQPRMVSLFMALYSAAGVRLTTEKPVQQRSAPPRFVIKPKPKHLIAAKPLERKPAFHSGGLPPMIAALLAELPEQGRTWTQEKRDKFVKMFESLLDFHYSVAEDGDTPEGDAE